MFDTRRWRLKVCPVNGMSGDIFSDWNPIKRCLLLKISLSPKTGWWLSPAPLKNDGLRQLGWWHSIHYGKIWKNKIHVPNHQPEYPTKTLKNSHMTCHRCASYDPVSQNRTTHWYEAVSSARNCSFLKEVSQWFASFLKLSSSNMEEFSQNFFVSDMSTSTSDGSLDR